MKNIVSVVLILSMLTIFVNDSFGQVRKRTISKTAKKEKTVKDDDGNDFIDKTYGELRFGNLGFFNGLSLSSKLNVGYKFHERFSVGGGMKIFFNQFVVQNAPDPSLTDLGGFVLARGKITEQIYAQAEYAFMNYQYYDNFGSKISKSANSPLIGLGYMSGLGKWKFGIELLYIVNEQARDYQNSIVEYWFGASYNF
jgi:hypothetical protein